MLAVFVTVALYGRAAPAQTVQAGQGPSGQAFGSQFRYAFVGNPNRCPTVAAPQFFSGTTELPTPNANLPADAMASMMAQLLSRIVTNPEHCAMNSSL
jgi:hypothetical protein